MTKSCLRFTSLWFIQYVLLEICFDNWRAIWMLEGCMMRLLKSPGKLFKRLVWVLFGRRRKFQIKFHANLFLEMNIFRVNHRMFWQKSSVVFIANEIMLPELKLPRDKSRTIAINGQWKVATNDQDASLYNVLISYKLYHITYMSHC